MHGIRDLLRIETLSCLVRTDVVNGPVANQGPLPDDFAFGIADSQQNQPRDYPAFGLVVSDACQGACRVRVRTTDSVFMSKRDLQSEGELKQGLFIASLR